jgi:hypothetical protein
MRTKLSWFLLALAVSGLSTDAGAARPRRWGRAIRSAPMEAISPIPPPLAELAVPPSAVTSTLAETASAVANIEEIHQLRGSVLAGTALEPPRSNGAIAADFTDVLEKVAGIQRSPTRDESSPTGRGPSLVANLRRQAHALDDLAAQLEDREHYQRADELRRVAAQLRNWAREASAAR